MTEVTITYMPLDLIILHVNSFDLAPEFKPELTCLDLGHGKPQRYWYPYRVCYLDRRSLDPTIRSSKERKKVNPLSVCAERVSFIQPIIKGLLEGHSGIPEFNQIESILDWIDRQRRSEELYNLDGARKLYREYTDLLRHRLRLSNVGDTTESIGYPRAQGLQSALVYVCSQACSLDPKVVQSWSIRIPQKKMALNELPAPVTTADEHALAYALHERFFTAFTQAVLNEIPPPVVVKLADLGFEDLIFYSQCVNNAGGWSPNGKSQRADWHPHFYQRDGVFDGSLTAFNALLAEHRIAPIENKSFKRMQDTNRHFTQRSLRLLANLATRHFGYLLLAEAGNNAAHLATINCHIVKLDKAIGIASTRAIKGRAGFETQDQHVDIRFAQTTWKQYHRLHTWMAQQLEAAPEFGLFLLSQRSHRAPYELLSSNTMRQLPHWPSNGPSLASRPARKHKSVNLFEASGSNIALVAGLQCATPLTIERHYNFKNRVEAAKVMSEYFAAQAKAAETRHLGVTPVRIIKSGEATLAGVCDSQEDGPKLIEGFEGFDIEPRCGAPITCMFCIHFGLHADIEDILRLLTIKLWIGVQSRLSSINIDEHFQKFSPYLNRIQQILDELSNMNGEKIQQSVKLALSRFDRGERDTYWNAKISALLDTQEA